MAGRRWAVGFLLLCVVLAPLGVSRPAQADTQVTPNLRIALMNLPRTMFPIGASTAEMLYLRGFVGRSLTIYDKSWAVACALCSELPTLENGGAKLVTRADGTKGIDVTFGLNPELRWDDGVPVTSADVLLSIDVAHKLGGGSGALSNVIDAVAPDDRHVTLHIANVRFDYNRLDELFLLPAHREKATFDAAESPGDYKAKSLYTTNPTSAGLSYGPFKIGKVTSDEITLVRNEYWHGKIPQFDSIILRKYGDISSIVADLKAKKIDMASGDTSLDLVGVYEMEATDTGSLFNFIFRPSLSYVHIDVNQSNPLLKDKRLREAMLLALDRPITADQRAQMVHDVVPSAFLPPNSPNFDPTLKPIPFDRNKAAATLDAAGFLLGADGIRVDGQGRRLSFRLIARLDIRSTKSNVETVQQQLRAVGIEINPENRTIEEALPKRDFDLALYTWSNSPEFLLEPVYGKSGIPSAENNYRGLNFPGFDNDEMNRVSAALNTEMDPSKRLLLWRRAQRIYAEELPALPLAFGVREYIVPGNMVGFEPTGHRIPTSYWVEDWKLH